MMSELLENQLSKLLYIIENGGLIMAVIFGLGFLIWFKLISLYYRGLIVEISPNHSLRSRSRALENDHTIVRALISICPLVGLLGSTTGMVVVFKAIEFFGTGATQVSLALPRVVVPTLVSLIIAISGLIGLIIFEQRVKLKKGRQLAK